MRQLNRIFQISLFFTSLLFFGQEGITQISINIGSSSDNKVTRINPASFVATYPQSNTISTSYAVKGFLEALYKIEALNLDISAIGELHRNTLISSKQNVRQIGMRVAYGMSVRKNYPKLYLQPEFSLKYTEDRINDKKGMQHLFYTSVEYDFAKGECFASILEPGGFYPSNERESYSKKSDSLKNQNPNEKKSGELLSDWVQVQHFNSIGLEHINYEEVLLFNASFAIEVYPFSGFLYSAFKQYNIIQLRYNVIFRKQLDSTQTSLFIGTTHNYAANLNIKLKKNGKTAITFGYEYFDGGDPLKGLAETKFGQLKVSLLSNLNF
ncbi:MAG: hypothetical protein ACSHW7_04910 [Patiriisocius sp.]|uniref:hypothetical protein n=1 Tax=Patiriisocius sp. TaxID=2822396 RepID=UPI003EF24F6E